MAQPNSSRSRPEFGVGRLVLVVVLGAIVVIIALALIGPMIGYHPLVACAVEADPTVAGKAYAQIEGIYEYERCSDLQSSGTTYAATYPTVYETDNYGQSWHLIQAPTGWDTWRIPHNIPGLTANANQLSYNGQLILSIPHQFSQLFAYSADRMGALDSPISSDAPVGQGVFYAAMGEYGLLIGPNPAENGSRSWQWEQCDSTACPALSPRAVTHPAETEGVIVFDLTLLLVFLIQSWLLDQVWRYMDSPDEENPARLLSRWVAGVISVFYLGIVVFWKSDANANFYVLTGMFAVCSVAFCVTIGVRVARRRQFTDAFVWKLGLVTGLLALFVPVVVAATATQLGWPLIMAVIIGFIVYRRGLRRYLNRFEARSTLWQTDRLTLEIEGLFVLMLVPMGLLSVVLSAVVFQSAVTVLIAFIAVPCIVAAIMWFYTKWRGHDFVLKKKASPLELHNTLLFGEAQWFRLLLGRTVLWLLGAAGMWLILVLPHLFILVNIETEYIRSHW